MIHLVNARRIGVPSTAAPIMATIVKHIYKFDQPQILAERDAKGSAKCSSVQRAKLYQRLVGRRPKPDHNFLHDKQTRGMTHALTGHPPNLPSVRHFYKAANCCERAF
jgi:hypothetical protein